MRLAFSLPVIPTAKGRHRMGVIAGHARAFADPKTERAELEVIALAAPHAPASPLEDALALTMTFRLPIPPSWPRWRQEAAAQGHQQPTGKPDLDNLVKLVKDALTRSGAWWRDDAQIVEYPRTRKVYTAGAPGVDVEIATVDEVLTAEAWKARSGAHRGHAPEPAGASLFK